MSDERCSSFSRHLKACAAPSEASIKFHRIVRGAHIQDTMTFALYVSDAVGNEHLTTSSTALLVK